MKKFFSYTTKKSPPKRAVAIIAIDHRMERTT